MFYCTTPPKPTSQPCILYRAGWNPTNQIWWFGRNFEITVSACESLIQCPWSAHTSNKCCYQCRLRFHIPKLPHKDWCSCWNSGSIDLVEIPHEKKNRKTKNRFGGEFFQKPRRWGIMSRQTTAGYEYLYVTTRWFISENPICGVSNEIKFFR